MVGLEGTRTIVHLPDAAWCRDAATWAFQCPDGVSRCVTIPNWRWIVWHWPAGPNPFGKHVVDAWRYAQLFSRYYPAAVLFADKLTRDVDLMHRRVQFQAANINLPPSIFDQFRGIVSLPARWGSGGASLVFNRHAKP